jgi:hypothetical protein
VKKIVATLAFAAAFALCIPTAANAQSKDPDDDVSVRSLCSGSRVVYKATKSGAVFSQASGANSAVTGGPGVTLGISKTRTFTVGGSITTTSGISASAVVASVKADVGVTIQASRSGTTTNSGSWRFPSNYKIGRLAIGSIKYSGRVTKYLENKNCVLVNLGAASYNAPKNEWHFSTSRVS